jgi:outer membrane protein insertion porin family
VRPITKLELLASVCLFLFATQAPSAQQPPENARTNYTVERLNITGNRRVETYTIRARISANPGDHYSVEAVQRDVQSLLNTGFFDDVRSEVEDSPSRPNEKIVMFIVKEKPLIASVDYKGIESISESNILAAFKDHKVDLAVGSWFDQTKLKRAAAVIGQLLASHGHPSATVNPTFERIPSRNTVTLVFNIDEGPKAQK